MPALPFLAVVGAVLAVDGYIKGDEARKNASEAQDRQRKAQEGIQSEQKAQNAQQAQAERIKQRREMIRKQAMIRQSAYNTGTGGASGEFGALSGLETGLSTAVGENAGALQTAGNISNLAQENANAGFDFATAGRDLQASGSQMNLGMSIFSMGAGKGGTSPSTGSDFGSTEWSQSINSNANARVKRQG